MRLTVAVGQFENLSTFHFTLASAEYGVLHEIPLPSG
jgi:hypothetical protein